MRITLTFLIITLMAFSGFAQDNLDYSYITDKRYKVVQELDGEIFVPAGYQLSLDEPQEIDAGEVFLKFAKNKVVIEGLDDIKDQFYVINRYPDKKVGFIYELMDSRNGAAKLKVVMQEGYIVLMYFNSKKWGEHTFYLAEKSAAAIEKEKSHFSSAKDFYIRSYSNLMDKKVIPYMVNKNFEQGKNRAKIEKDAGIFFEFKEKHVNTKWGDYEIKNAKTWDYKLKGDPSIASRIDIDLKGKVKKMYIYLNFDREVAFIEVGKQRFYLLQ